MPTYEVSYSGTTVVNADDAVDAKAIVQEDLLDLQTQVPDVLADFSVDLVEEVK